MTTVVTLRLEAKLGLWALEGRKKVGCARKPQLYSGIGLPALPLLYFTFHTQMWALPRPLLELKAPLHLWTSLGFPLFWFLCIQGVTLD